MRIVRITLWAHDDPIASVPRPSRIAAGSPCHAGPAMIVCLCHRVSDRDIAREAHAGCSSFEELQAELRVATGCGACLDCAQATFSEHRAGGTAPCHAWPARGSRDNTAPGRLAVSERV